MTRVKGALTAAIGLAVGWGLAGESDETVLGEGVNAAFSPDGRRIAFQRLVDREMRLGVMDLANGSVIWVENGCGMAGFPCWTPSGGLVYMFGNDYETSFQANRNKSKSCYGIWLWEDGVKRALTGGRCRDYTPAVTPDGKRVYFATTRWVRRTSKTYSTASTSMIGYVDVAGGEPVMAVDSPKGNNSGVCQPAVSPDGKYLVWGHLGDFSNGWRIFGSPLADTSRAAWCPVTPMGLVATAPRWHPNGRLICFTGFLKGDPGWGVWVEDVYRGTVKRLCSGQNPDFSPDGKWLVYDRDRRLYRRTFGAGDEPDTVLPEPADDMRLPEKVLLRKEGPITSAVRIPVSDRKDLAFGTAQTFFVRVRVRWDGTEGLRHCVIGEYDEHALAFEIFLNKDLWFSSRNLHKEFKGAMTKLDMKPGEHVFTGIRTSDKFFVAVDGNAPGITGSDSRMALDHPRTLVIAPDLHPGEAVLEVEVGTGWPTNVSKIRTREDLFK